MGKMKRILCVSMAFVLAMGFCLSSVIFTSAELILDKGIFNWTHLVHDDDVFMHFSPEGLNMWENVPFTYTATGAKNFYINETVAERVFPFHGKSAKFDIRVGFDVELGLDLPEEASAVAITCGLSLTGFDSNMYYDKDLFDTHSVVMWVNDTHKYDITSSVHTSKETTSDGWWRCYIDFYALLEVDVPKHDIDRVTIIWESGYFVDGIYDLHPFDYSLDLDNGNYPFIGVEGSLPFSSYDDVIRAFNEQSAIIVNQFEYAILNGSDKFNDNISGLQNGASDLNDVSQSISAGASDPLNKLHGSLQSLIDITPDYNPLDSIDDVYEILFSSNGSFISRIWDLIMANKILYLFVTAGLIMVMAYFFLRR